MLLWRGVSRVITLCLALLVSACSIYSSPGSQPVPVDKQPDYTEPAHRPATPSATPVSPSSRPAASSASAAYQPLLAKADQASARGDYEAAFALLERAQRIDPGSAEVYLSMARTHAAKGDSAQARVTAERGLLYCSSTAQCDALREYTR